MEIISIIIPVYNTGIYLKKCIDSIKVQTYKNIEIIIVDDGSEQETASLCDELAKTDARIRLFHKKNEGVSVARNFGLSKAIGSYIGFIDSDDWIASEMFEKLYNALKENNVNIVYCDLTTIWDDGKTESDTFSLLIKSQLLLRDDITPSVLCEIAGSACRGLYRREILEGVEFPMGLKFSEDRIFNLYALAKVDSIYYLKEELYFRYMRKGSCVRSYCPDAIEITQRVNNIVFPFVETNFGTRYYIEYEKKGMNAFVGFMYSALGSDKSLIGKFKDVKRIASHPDIPIGIQKFGLVDKRLLLAGKHQFILLFILLYLHKILIRR